MTLSLPPIHDDDIEWVCDLLGLPKTAFTGEDGSDARQAVLRSHDTIDVEACPGSGKTTLLVAKLAILARKWPSKRRGICVLSHTNAARNEVERRLSAVAEGRALLAYPHFIGTIHSFVNEYLAIPYMRSIGQPVHIIDDAIALEWRWRRLPRNLRTTLERRYMSSNNLRYSDTSFSVTLRGLGAHTASAQAVNAVCAESAQAGMHCYDEMFIWAKQLLGDYQGVPELIRQRFPRLFIDEVQDTNEPQSELIFELFSADSLPVVRQRFGDINQAIYRYAGESGAITDPFPTDGVTHELENSFRFGQAIANHAQPFAVRAQNLTGKGGRTDADDRHAIFLFEDAAIEHVLPAYSEFLLEQFSDQELLEGDFRAVGAIHRQDKDDNLPRHVPHYFPNYRADQSGQSADAKSLCGYVVAGRSTAASSSNVNDAIDGFVRGLIRSIRMIDANCGPQRPHRNWHRYMLDKLENLHSAHSAYMELIELVCIEREALSEDLWDQRVQPKVEIILSEICGTPDRSADLCRFLQWDHQAESEETVESSQPPKNSYYFPEAERKYEIKLGSIHSVKGETHTATLVLETFNRSHQLDALKGWLLGDQSGGTNQSKTNQDRLRLHYVAMTRPSRCLCLALRIDSFDDDERERLKVRGWELCLIAADGSKSWL